MKFKMFLDDTTNNIITLLQNNPYDVELLASISKSERGNVDAAYSIVTLSDGYWQLVLRSEIRDYREQIIRKLNDQQVIDLFKKIPTDKLDLIVHRFAELGKVSIQLLNWLIDTEYLVKVTRSTLRYYAETAVVKSFFGYDNNLSITKEYALQILDIFLSTTKTTKSIRWQELVNRIREDSIGQEWCIKNIARIPLTIKESILIAKDIKLSGETRLYTKLIYKILDDYTTIKFSVAKNLKFPEIIEFSSMLKKAVNDVYQEINSYVADENIAHVIMQYTYSEEHIVDIKNLLKDKALDNAKINDMASDLVESNIKLNSVKNYITPYNINRVLSCADLLVDIKITYQNRTQDNVVSLATNIVKLVGGIILQDNIYVLWSAAGFGMAYELYSKSKNGDYSQVILSVSSSLIATMVVTKGLLLMSPYAATITLTFLYGVKVAYHWHESFLDNNDNCQVVGISHEETKNILLGQQPVNDIFGSDFTIS